MWMTVCCILHLAHSTSALYCIHCLCFATFIVLSVRFSTINNKNNSYLWVFVFGWAAVVLCRDLGSRAYNAGQIITNSKWPIQYTDVYTCKDTDDSLMHSSIHWFIHTFTESFTILSHTLSFPRSLTHSLIYSINDSFLFISLTHSYIHLLIQLFTNSLIRIFIYSLTHSYIHSLIQLFTKSLTH